ncbi:MAG: FAD-dependent oxidoreductase [Saprospiraceae bacterium]|nr:FAD-dependent oxidoreductase [Saprospiraceae bacterium]
MEILIDNGLPKMKNFKPKKVLIVGAGITGLVTGSLLKQAGHDVTIIEANANRIGGRIKTFHKNPFNPTETPPFQDPKQYAEAGAMRLPDFHPLVLALIDKHNLKRQLFYNVSVNPDTGNTSGHTPPVVYEPFDGSGAWKYGTDNPNWKAPEKVNNTWIRTNEIQMRKKDYNDPEHIEKLNKGFEMKGPDLRKTTSDLLNEVLDPVRDRYSDVIDGKRVNKPFEQWIEGWASVIYDFDGFSMYGFLKKFAKKKNKKPLTDNEIEAIGTIENLTSRLALSFMHSFLGRADINPNVTYYEIEGGSWMLPYAFLPELYNNIVMNRRMTHIEYYDPKRNPGYTHRFTSAKPGEKVSVRTLSETKVSDGKYDHEEEIFKADHCLITIPFSSLRHVSVSPAFSYKKRRAIIELHYDAATKVLLEFNQRWWEFKNEAEWKNGLKEVKKAMGKEQYDELKRIWMERDPRRINAKPIISNYVGGGSVTDNPNRFIYVPSHKIPGSNGGVLLASYSWSDDARRWDSMEEHDRYLAAMRGLVDIHGWQAAMFYTGKGKTQSWTQSPYAFGEAAVFTPGQMTSFHLDIPTAEGPVHFAGEHVSLKHAWIEGCLETGTRAALEIHKAL